MIYQFFFDALLACITGIGFTNAANAPTRTIIYCGFLGGIGHALRYSFLTIDPNFSIVLATLISSAAVGFLAVLFAQLKKVPIEVIAFPALIPMIPGVYAYKAIVSIFMFLNAEENSPDQVRYLTEFFSHFFLATFVVLALAVGISIVLLIFSEKAFSMTRGLKLKKIYEKELAFMKKQEEIDEQK